MRSLILSMLMSATGAMAQAPSQAPVSLVTKEFAPYIISKEGVASGIATDIVGILFQRVGIGTDGPELVPWARALKRAANGPRTCLFSAARVPEREKLYKWVGPLARAEWVLFARKSDQVRLQSLDDARGRKIGTYIGDMSETYLRERGHNVETAGADVLNPQKLRSGRIELWSVARHPGMAILKGLGYEDMEVVLRYTDVDLYLGCSRDVPDETIARLNEALRQLQLEGGVQQIYKRYGYEEK
ncbi:substrate-binding periplasmic protein [Pseudoduganella sp. OTU4001]|uniref:substrate-binding periplasmic protein n=1 Tax=Pseudoduganella sp. OTU4001 TaxID=3043854 RepID=UPI00313E60BB